MNAQLYDLHGKPTEKATAEEWWSSPQRYRIEIKSPSLQETRSSLNATRATEIHRTGLLLRKLLQQSVNPLGSRKQTDLHVEVVDRNLGGLSMRCLLLTHIWPGTNHSRPPVGQVPQGYCSDASGALRVSSNQNEVITRNRVGRFHETIVALKTSIAYLNREAITGEVDALETFDPSKSALAEFAAGSAPSESKTADDTAALTAGQKMSGQNPLYPALARQQHRSGSVILCILISATGTVASADVLAGTDPLLDDAAMDAVRTWTYRPLLMNGKPIASEAEVTTTFAIGS